MNDFDLLQAYAHKGDEDAFAVLVRRNINLVYSAALRLLRGDTHAAEDVTQAVFADLARKAPRIPPTIPVAGWLHRHTHFMASNFVRAEHRRGIREQQASMKSADSPTPHPEWLPIGPVLDEAMQELADQDRFALLLRFFRGQALREVGDALGISEDAARKRVDRALDRLREALLRRGITSTSGVLGSLLAAHVISIAPVGLAAGVCASALAGPGTSAAISTIGGMLDVMNAAKLKMGAIGLALAAGVAVPVWQQTKLDHARAQLAAVTPQLRELDQLRAAGQAATSASSDVDELNRLRRQQGELLRLRSEVALLRSATNELAQAAAIYRNQNELLRAKFQLDAATPESLSLRLKLNNPYLPRDQWTDKGAGTPLEALESLLAADRQANRERMLELIDREEMEQRGLLTGHYSIGASERPERATKVIGMQVVDRTGNKERTTARIGAIIEKEHPWPPGIPQPEGVRHIVHDSVIWHFKQTPEGWRVTHRE